MKKRVLLVVVGIITLSAVLAWVAPNAGAVSSNLTCYKDGQPPALRYDVWSRFIKISIPIPGLTHQLLCFDETSTTKEPADKFYYTESLGDYLANFYQYFVSIVGILGAVMIMYGGIRWILAAGNQSRIQGAKNVIFSAVIGIVIAFGSYLLLFLLNPRLVDYALLEKHLTNVTAVAQATDLCVDFHANSNPKLVNPETGQEYDPAQYKFQYYILEDPNAGKVETSPTSLVCGQEAAIIEQSLINSVTPGTKSSTCQGSKCNPGQACISIDEGTIVSKYECVDAFLSGRIDYDGAAYIDKIKLVPLCTDGKEKIETPGGGSSGVSLENDLSEFANYYVFPFTGGASSRTTITDPLYHYGQHISLLMGDCVRVITGKYVPEPGKTELDYFAGFYLDIEVNDDQGWFFNLGPTVDDNFAVGTDCKPLGNINWQEKDPGDVTEDEWVTAYLNKDLIRWDELFYSPSDPFAPDKCKTHGNFWCLRKHKTCNFNILRSSFPSR